MSVQINRCTVDDIVNAPGLDALVSEYSDYGVAGMPAPVPEWERYRALEKLGALDCVLVLADARIVGLAAVLTTPSMHFGVDVSFADALFVCRAHRATGAGVKLIREVEQIAGGRGAYCVAITTLQGAELDTILPRWGFRPSHTTYTKVLR